jgi:hypothetical protein
MILSVLLLVIALLLLPLSFIRGGEIDAMANPAIADPVSAKPFLTGVRLSSWDGQRQLFVLQIESLELIWKTLGPFQLEEHRDISAINCYLRSDSASLAGNLQEIEKLLFPMIQSLKNPIPKDSSASPPELDAKPVSYTEKLIGLPPALKARPFACAISQPQGLETIFRADLATFDPTQTDISLEGNVAVQGDNQTRLTAEHIIWSVTPQELNVEGAYRFQTGEREIKGRDACFSIAGGGLEPVKLTNTQTLPCLRELPSSAPMAPFMISQSGKGLRPRKKTILSHLSRTLFQMMRATVAPTDQRLTSAKSSKQKVYPAPSPITHSLEETVDRELFSEKSR